MIKLFSILFISYLILPVCAQGETLYLSNQPPGFAESFQQGMEAGHRLREQRMERESFAQQQALAQQQQRNLELQNELLEQQLQKKHK